jgi:hypothetical protein
MYPIGFLGSTIALKFENMSLGHSFAAKKSCSIDGSPNYELSGVIEIEAREHCTVPLKRNPSLSGEQ